MPTRSKTKAKAKPRPITARQLLKHVSEIQETRDLEALTIIGALCEVIARHPPSARRAAAVLEQLLDEVGVR